MSIIKYYGGNITLERVISDTCTNQEGTTAFNIIDSAKKYGFDSAGFQIEETEINNVSLTLPAICHVVLNNLQHFVVLYHLDNKKAIIMDPAFGKKVLSKDEFLKIWTKKIIEFYPSREIVFFKKETKLIDLFIKIIKTEKGLVWQIILASVILMILTIINGYYFKVSLENLDNGFKFLKIIFLLFFIVTLFKAILSQLRLYYENHLNKNIDVHLFKDFINHILNLPLKMVQSRTIGEIIARINDLNNFKNLFSEIFVSLILDSLLIIFLIPVLIYINKILFFILLGILLIYLILGITFKKVLYKKILKNMELEDKFSSIFVESITMISSIKNLSITGKILNYIEKNVSRFMYDNYRLIKTSNLQISLKTYVNEIGFYLVNTVGFILVYQNKLTLPNLITFNSLMIFFLDPVKNIINNIPKYNFVRASIHKLSEFMNIEKEVLGQEEKIDNFDIKLQNVSFSYNKINYVLNNFNLNVKLGEHILIKGKSGCGKSTICKLIAKCEKLEKGNLTIGNISINDLSLSTIKKNILYVSQKEYLYSDTLKNNILFFRNLNLKLFTEICKICCVDEIIKNKPLRYETYINVDSNNLSGGEKQRIVLARACLNDFKILIIDEALSEVDIFTERKIINNLKNLFKDKTIIYVSHKNLDNYFQQVINV